MLRGALHFGGNCRQWLFDNPKTIALGRVGDAVRFHPLLLDFAGKMYVQPRVCAVRKANQKGRVERAIRFSRDRFLAGREITTVEQGNREFAEFISGIALDRPHPTIPNRTVRDCFEEEQHRLLALPQALPENRPRHPRARGQDGLRALRCQLLLGASALRPRDAHHRGR
jgi:hypothetical protein